MKTIALLILFVMTACTINQPPVESGAAEASSVDDLLNPPAPTPEFQFCSGFVTCNPLQDGNGDFNCTLDCAEPAWCPPYTASEWSNCQNHPFSSGCCSDSGLDGIPCFPKRCIKGDRP